VLELKIESWMAIAPGLSLEEQWRDWCLNPFTLADSKIPTDLSSISPILRRRFSPLGKTALSSILPLLKDDEKIVSVFASRHGDTKLTLSLLETIGLEQDVSPTKFSLAVHNAVSGLFSIARNDTSAMTSIAAKDGLFLQALLESAGQLLDCERVLCVIHDVPLPDDYHRFATTPNYPYAIAVIFNRSKGQSLRIESSDCAYDDIDHAAFTADYGQEFTFAGLLAGAWQNMQCCVHNRHWRVSLAQ